MHNIVKYFGYKNLKIQNINIMSFNASFIHQLQQKKKLINSQWKQVKVDLAQLVHKVQNATYKTQRLKITEQQFIYLIKTSKAIFLKQQSLLKIQAPIHVCTGTLGSYKQLFDIFLRCGKPKFFNYLFLGDYTGKFKRGIQCLVALLLYKIKFPYNFFLLRGCLESVSMTKNYDLYEQIIQSFGSNRAWVQICQLFCCLPFSAVINQKIFCTHGCISQYLFSLQQINLIKRPLDIPKKGLPYDLVFSSASYEGQNSQQNLKQGIFGQKQAQNFLKRTNLKIIVKGHQVVQKGYEYMFNKSLVKLCSVSNVSGFYSNASAIMMIDDQFNVIFRKINNQMFTKQQNYQDLDMAFQTAVQMKKQKQSQIQQILRKEEQKRKQVEDKKSKYKQEKSKKQYRKKQKQQRKLLKRLKEQMLKQKQQKEVQTSNKQNQSLQN